MDIYSTGEVSKLLGVQPYRISYAIISGQLPEASFRFLGKRCFNADDIAKIAEHFHISLESFDTRTEGECRWRLVAGCFHGLAGGIRDGLIAGSRAGLELTWRVRTTAQRRSGDK